MIIWGFDVWLLPITYATFKGQQFTARSARSNQLQTQTGTVI